MSTPTSLSLRSLVLLGLGIVLAPAMIGIPLLAMAAGDILAWAHRRPRTGRETGAGWVAVIFLAVAVVIGVVLGLGAAEPLALVLGDDDPAIVAIAIIAPLLAGFLFAPMAFAPSLALHGSRAAWLSESIWLAAHAGAARTALLGLQLGAHAALPFALALAVATAVDDDHAFLAFLAGLGLTVLAAPLTLRHVASSFELAHARAGETRRASAALAALGRLALGPLVALLAFVGLAAAAPLPMREVPRDVPALDGPVAGYAMPLTIDGTDIEISAAFRAIRISTPRGVTRVPMGYVWDLSAHVERARHQGRPVYVVTFTNEWDPHDYELIVDEQGRRLGDDVDVRLRERIPGIALVLLALASLIGVSTALRIGTALSRVRTIARVLGGAAGDLTIVSGVLRVAGAPVSLERGRLRASGGAAIEADGGALRIALPDTPVEVLASDPTLGAAIPDGARVVLLAKDARLGGVGHRDASAPFPARGALVLGDPGAAQIALVRRSFPILGRLAIALGAVVVLAALAIGIASS